MTTINLGKVVGDDGEDGRGITSIEKTGTEGLVDTYTITYTDGTTSTYTVTNGSSGGGGTANYNELENKPSINNVSLQGNKSLSDLGVQPAGDYLTTETDPVFSASASAGITSTDITNWNGKGTYSKPSGGIPKTDLASAVRTSLDKADSAIQDISGKQDILVSGTNIKTINDESLLGEGNITIEGGTPVSPLADKNIVVFGDSLTDPQSGGTAWTESFINIAEYNSFRGYGRGYCTWTFKNNTEYNITDNTDANVGSNVIWNQFNKLKHDVDNENTPAPDILMIFCADNDIMQNKTIGTESATFKAEAQSSDVKTLTNLMDSIRYNIDTINAEYPNCIIVPIIPLLPSQYEKSKTYREALITCYNNLGLSYIDVMYGSGIAWYREMMRRSYFANDGIHLSPAGSMKVASYIYQALVTMPRIQNVTQSTTPKSLYNVYYTLTNATSTNSFASIMQGEPYRTTISATTGHTLTSVTCTMGGVTQPVESGVINIASVTGDIRITAVGGDPTPTTYTITNNLTNATNSNAATSIAEGESYTATISANQGYHITSVVCTMGGVEQTVTNNTINIASVSGNIVITATAEQDQPTTTYTVTNNLTNATNSNAATSIEEGSAYTATISANQGYNMSSIVCTMGGVEQTVTNNTINIASVSGNIVITATATQFVPVEGAYIHNDGNCWVGSSYYTSRNTTKLEVVAEIHSYGSAGYSYLVGSSDTKLCQWNQNQVLSCVAGTGSQSASTNWVSISFDKKFTVVGDIANQTISITDEDGTRTGNILVGTQYKSHPIWYFAGYWQGSLEHKSGDMKVYSMKIWEGDTLVYEGYPINDANGAGMYDTISGDTHYNEGTGTLTYGVDSAS